MLSFLFKGETYIDNSNRIVFIAFFALSYFLFTPLICERNKLVNLFGILIFIYVGQRLVFISFYTAHNFEHYYYLPYMVNRILLELIIYIIIFHLNLFSLTSAFKKVYEKVGMVSKLISQPRMLFKISVVLFILSTLSRLAITQFASMNGLRDAESISFFSRYIARFVYPEFYFIVVIVIYFISLKGKGKPPTSLYYFIIVYVVSTVLSGSKEGFFAIIILVMIYYIFFDSNFKIKVGIKFILVSGAIVLFSILSFATIETIRFLLWHHTDTDFVGIIRQNDKFFLNTLATISRRLSIVEDSIKINYSEVLGFTDISSYVNLRTVIQLAIDSVVPTLLFPGLLKSQFALSYILNNGPRVMDGNEIYTGYWWGFYMYHKYVFGFWPGLIVMTAFVRLTFKYMSIIIKNTSSIFIVFFFFFFLYKFFYYYLGFFGYEHILSFYFDVLLRFYLNYLVLVLIMRIVAPKNQSLNISKR